MRAGVLFMFRQRLFDVGPNWRGERRERERGRKGKENERSKACVGIGVCVMCLLQREKVAFERRLMGLAVLLKGSWGYEQGLNAGLCNQGPLSAMQMTPFSIAYCTHSNHLIRTANVIFRAQARCTAWSLCVCACMRVCVCVREREREREREYVCFRKNFKRDPRRVVYKSFPLKAVFCVLKYLQMNALYLI